VRALAAQDTLKNLFATLTIMADRPCSVGDLIVIDDSMGFVEDIQRWRFETSILPSDWGFRTVRLRANWAPIYSQPVNYCRQ